MATNKSLRVASKIKQDEFYTQLCDIEYELKHYKSQFKDKIIFCNCDDPYESNFFKYFAMNFNYLGLKKLIATCYDSSPIAYTQLNLFGENKTVPNNNRHPYKIEINEVQDYNKDGATDLADVEYLLKNKKNSLSLLKENGDFRSNECIELLKQSDIIVTNPPFSLFREYVSLLVEHDKTFLIIGSQNAITYKEIFNLIKQNKLWLGYRCGDMSFMVPDYYEARTTRFWIDEKGKKWRSMGNICWFTNMDTIKRHENIDLYQKYNSTIYPYYDNYNAINIDKVSEIPYDYNGYMGVPITFLDKYNPEQFELLGIMNTGEQNEGIRYKNTPHGRPIVNGIEKYLRILIRRKTNEN